MSLFNRHFFTVGEDLVTAVVLVPLGDRRVLVHVLDDVSPADTRVVCAEGNFAFLRAVGDDAHFGAAEIVVEEILEPHSRDKQEVPRVLTALLDILDGAVPADLSVILTRQAERLVELLQDAAERQAVRCAVRVVVFEKCEAHHEIREPLAAVGVGDVLHVRDEALNVQELRHRCHFLCFLVDHHGRADAAVRVAAAGDLSPIVFRSVDNVGEIGERSHQRKREPIARRLGDTDLILHVVREMSQRVTLLQATLLGDQFVAARETKPAGTR